MEIKFGKFFQNAQEKDKEMKIMIEIKSDMEDISKELQYAYIKNSREREREKTGEMEGEEMVYIRR